MESTIEISVHLDLQKITARAVEFMEHARGCVRCRESMLKGSIKGCAEGLRIVESIALAILLPMARAEVTALAEPTDQPH